MGEYGQIKLKMMILGMCCTRKDEARQGDAASY